MEERGAERRDRRSRSRSMNSPPHRSGFSESSRSVEGRTGADACSSTVVVIYDPTGAEYYRCNLSTDVRIGELFSRVMLSNYKAGKAFKLFYKDWCLEAHHKLSEYTTDSPVELQITWSSAGDPRHSLCYNNFAWITQQGAVQSVTPFPGRRTVKVSTIRFTDCVGLCGNEKAFAALRGDGLVQTWGDAEFGGNSSSVAAELRRREIVSVTATESAFAALDTNGGVLTWGREDHGGRSTHVAHELTDVISIHAALTAFAAIRQDGSVVTWGDVGNLFTDDFVPPHDLSSGVVHVTGNYSAFAAIKSDGSVVTWGTGLSGGDSSSVAYEVSHSVISICALAHAFAALKSDGSVVSWGHCHTYKVVPSGSVSSGVVFDTSGSVSSGVVSVVGNSYAFAALKSDGSVVTWGWELYDTYNLLSDLLSESTEEVVKIAYTSRAFAALTSKEKVVTWGKPVEGGHLSTHLRNVLSADVVTVHGNPDQFMAIKRDGTLAIWGSRHDGHGEAFHLLFVPRRLAYDERVSKFARRQAGFS